MFYQKEHEESRSKKCKHGGGVVRKTGVMDARTKNNLVSENRKKTWEKEVVKHARISAGLQKRQVASKNKETLNSLGKKGEIIHLGNAIGLLPFVWECGEQSSGTHIP